MQCFGAPFIVAHVDGKKETFFGADRFPVLAMVIGENGAKDWKGRFNYDNNNERIFRAPFHVKHAQLR